MSTILLYKCLILFLLVNTIKKRGSSGDCHVYSRVMPSCMCMGIQEFQITSSSSARALQIQRQGNERWLWLSSPVIASFWQLRGVVSYTWIIFLCYSIFLKIKLSLRLRAWKHVTLHLGRIVLKTLTVLRTYFWVFNMRQSQILKVLVIFPERVPSL